MSATVPNPSDMKEEPFDFEEQEKRYPRQKNQFDKERKIIKPKDGLDLKVGQCITDIPVKERHRYMWIVPDELKDHPQYKEEDWGGRMIREDKERIKKEEDDKKEKERDKEKKEKDKDDAIQLLLKHVSLLTEQVNELTKQMKK